jgi:cytochrome c55X
MRLFGGLLLLCSLVEPAFAAPDAARQDQLEHMVRQDCGSCHGMTLKGGLGSPLLPEALAGKDDGFLTAAILDGRPGTAMPPWRGLLSDQDVRWIVDYLKEGRRD